MKNPIETINQNIPIPNSKEIICSIETDFREIAKNIILDNLYMSDECNKSFFNNPDDPKEHRPDWHQWGIITHTGKVKESYQEEILPYLKLWGIKEKVISYMAEKIDGKTKDELFKIAIMFHDLGKFVSRKKIKVKDGAAINFTFKEHEKASGRIIRSRQFNPRLKKKYGLSDNQIEYIARCAELHYALGKIRRQVKESGGVYTIDFANSAIFHQKAKEIIDENEKYALEIGLFFLADSFGKTDIRINALTDIEIKNNGNDIKKTLLRRGLDSRLIGAVKEVSIGTAIAESYLKIWANV